MTGVGLRSEKGTLNFKRNELRRRSSFSAFRAVDFVPPVACASVDPIRTPPGLSVNFALLYGDRPDRCRFASFAARSYASIVNRSASVNYPPGERGSAKTQRTIVTFEKFGLTKKVLRTLESLGLHEATPLQNRIIESVMRNRRVLICAPNGAGKTTALIVALIARLQKEPPPEGRPVRAVIVTPPVGLSVGHEVVERFKILAADTDLRILNLTYQRSEAKLRAHLEKHRPDILVGSLARMVEFARISDVSHIEAIIYPRLDRSVAEETAKPYALWTNIFPEAAAVGTLEEGAHEKTARDAMPRAEEWFDSYPGPVPGTVDYFLAANFRFPYSMYDFLWHWSEENGFRKILLVTKDDKERDRFLLGEGPWKGRIATATLQEIESRSVWPSDYEVSFLWPSLLSPEDNARAACRGTADAAPVTVALVISEKLAACKRLALHLDRKLKIVNPIGAQFAFPYELSVGEMARRWTALHPFYQGPQYDVPVGTASAAPLEKSKSAKSPESVEPIASNATKSESATDNALEFLRSTDFTRADEAFEPVRTSEVKNEEAEPVEAIEPIEDVKPLESLEAPVLEGEAAGESSDDVSSDADRADGAEVSENADVAEVSDDEHEEHLHAEEPHRRTLTIRADYVVEKAHAPETEIVITEPLSSSSAALRASERRHATSERLTHQLVAEQGKNRRTRRMPHLPSDSTGLMSEKTERKKARDRKESDRRERLKTEKQKTRAEQPKVARRKEVEASERRNEKKARNERRRERAEKTETSASGPIAHVVRKERNAERAERVERTENKTANDSARRAENDEAVLLVRFNEKAVLPPATSASRGAFKVYFATRDLARRSRQLSKAERDSASAEAELEALRANNPEAVGDELRRFEENHDRSKKIARSKIVSPTGTNIEEAIVRAHNARIDLELARRNHRQAYYAKAKTEMRYAGDVPEELRSSYGVTEETIASHVAWKLEQAKKNAARASESTAEPVETSAPTAPIAPETAEAQPARRENPKKKTQRPGKRGRGARTGHVADATDAVDSAALATSAPTDVAKETKGVESAPQSPAPNAPKSADLPTSAVEEEGAKAPRRAEGSKSSSGKRAKSAEKPSERSDKNRGAKGRRDARPKKTARAQNRPERDEAGDVNGNRALPEPKEEFLDDDFGNSIHYRTIAERQAAKARPKSARTSDGIPSPLATSFGIYTPDPYGSLSLPQTMPGLTGRASSVHVFGSGTDPYSGARIPPMRDKAPSGKRGSSSKGSKGQKSRQPSKASANPKGNAPGKGASDRARKGGRRGGPSKD